MAHLVKRVKGMKVTWFIRDHDAASGRRPEKSTGTGDKRKAHAKLVQYEVRKLAGVRSAERAEKRGLRLTEFERIYSDYRMTAHKAVKTLGVDRYAFGYLLEIWGNMAIRLVTPWMVRDLRDNLMGRLRPASVNMILRAAKTAFFWAAEGSARRYLEANPFKQKGLMVPMGDTGAPLCLTEAERSALLTAVEGTDFGRMVKFLLLTGCRRNEALHLAWADLDLEHHQIVFWKTKTKRPRQIPISLELMQTVAELDRRQERPFPFKPEWVTRQFKRVARRAGMREEIHLHCLRHTAASDLVRAGVHPMQIQKFLGHSDLRVTAIYTHILPEDLREAAEQLTCCK
jgi:integrase